MRKNISIRREIKDFLKEIVFTLIQDFPNHLRWNIFFEATLINILQKIKYCNHLLLVTALS